jgi:hypothetical protein
MYMCIILLHCSFKFEIILLHQVFYYFHKTKNSVLCFTEINRLKIQSQSQIYDCGGTGAIEM